MAGIAVFGVTGRMGQCIVRALGETLNKSSGEATVALRLTGALASRASARLGLDAAIGSSPTGVRVTADVQHALEGAAVAVDFSHPRSVAEHAEACAVARVPLLIGATGLDATAHAALEGIASRVAVLVAPNTSLGVAVLNRLVALATRALGPAADIEIVEVHHRAKRDAPSGTALALGASVARARGATLDELAVLDRASGRSARAEGSIGFSTLRAGDVVGEHTVMFALPGERLELSHRASDRMIFARGALTAARWLIDRPAGRYSMADVLDG